MPDVSIICNMRDRKNVSFTGIPRFSWKSYPILQKNTTGMKKCRYTVEQAFLNTGSLTGAKTG